MTITLSEGIQLYSGAFFDYNNPEESNVDIYDIALALSHICRFAGHVSSFYSVAQHAVNVSLIVPREHALTALMHDTAEAFTNDIPTPLKFAIPAFKELETRIEMAMSKRFGFEFPLPEPVKYADLQMLKIEKELRKPHASGRWEVLDGVETDEIELLPKMRLMMPQEARELFLARYEALTR